LPNRPATITETDVRRFLRAGKKENIPVIVVTTPGGVTATYRLKDDHPNFSSKNDDKIIPL
jgi:hypothetical protein